MMLHTATMDCFTDQPHETLRSEVRRFTEDEVRPRVPQAEACQQVDYELSRAVARQGWIGATIPRAYGGMGLGHVAQTVIIEELSRISAAMGAMVQTSQLGVATVLHFGTEEQKRSWLPRFASGASLPTIAVTEPESGGHVLGMSGTAKWCRDEYILNGRKWFGGISRSPQRLYLLSDTHRAGPVESLQHGWILGLE